jgi:hypothetical protein
MAEVICHDTPGTCDGKDQPDNLPKFEAAVAKASKLADMCGKGYRGLVWENVGWHYRAISACGRVEVHCSEHKGIKTSYNAAIHEPGGHGYSAAFGRMPSRNTPKGAIVGAIAQVRKYARSIIALTEGL